MRRRRFATGAGVGTLVDGVGAFTTGAGAVVYFTGVEATVSSDVVLVICGGGAPDDTVEMCVALWKTVRLRVQRIRGELLW